jgi:ABC-type branched-subunit amino acid transport system substrate-binding protein
VALAAAAALAAGACGGGAERGDDAIEVMVIADPERLAEAAGGAQAAAVAVNGRGGIHGRRLVVLPCDTRNRPEDAEACAQEAVDREMVATVGSFTDHGGVVVPLLEDEGIAHVGVFPVSGPDFDSPISFPLVGGSPTVLVGMGAVLADHGARRVFVVHPEGTAGEAAATLVRIGLRNRGLDPAASAP